MLSDIYIEIYNNPSSAVIDLSDVGEHSPNWFVDSPISSTQFGYGVFSVDIQHLCVSYKKENISQSDCSLFFVLCWKTIYGFQYNIIYYFST